MLQSQIKTSPVVVFSVLSGLHQGQKVAVHLGETMTVGRSSSLEISILDSRMSRRHFNIDATGAEWVVQDLGSLNGTFVNGISVDRVELQQGDVVMAGDTKFQISFLQGSGSAIRSSSVPLRKLDKKASNRTTSKFDDLG